MTRPTSLELADTIRAMTVALRHAIYRNHDYTEFCDACREATALVHKVEQQGAEDAE